jgi:hypothetical protein
MALRCGEAAEADDDVAVDDHPLGHLGIRCLGGQRQALVLVGQVLRVLERQQHELPHRRRHGQVPAVRRGSPRDGAGLGVGGEGVGGSAVEVARELVEQQEQRQRPLGRPGPGVELAARGAVMVRLEAFADRRIEDVVLGVPLLGARFGPEAEDVVRRRGHGPSLGAKPLGRSSAVHPSFANSQRKGPFGPRVPRSRMD